MVFIKITKSNINLPLILIIIIQISILCAFIFLNDTYRLYNRNSTVNHPTENATITGKHDNLS